LPHAIIDAAIDAEAAAAIIDADTLHTIAAAAEYYCYAINIEAATLPAAEPLPAVMLMTFFITAGHMAPRHIETLMPLMMLYFAAFATLMPLRLLRPFAAG